ncbi:Di-copper centre-containing protein [Massarina eburnea CBS 473.64]|uniref:Di-copper centre-containing protein n=1 Tax=Massarina eburnea CBS 473.64 TaxID=1395130 RepID=A0A6A6S7G3_9PLEO|nr:Di-copper centre-containing protein [Massarina eburnea CBS 473.64]
MKTTTFLQAAGVCLFGAASASTNATLDALVSESTSNLQSILEDRVQNASATCTSKNVQVRKEWSALASDEKLDYIDAVKCLLNTKQITPASAAPAVHNRFDDFAALHVNRTSVIHWTSYFFTWHRYYTWLYEQALRDECGYNGTQPYWDWSSTDTVTAHPLFDGSELSMGGNGVQTDHVATVYLPTPNVTSSILVSGTGGGCVTTGPFVNLTVSLGPHGAPMNDNGMVGNDRCLTRDFRDRYLQSTLSYDNVTTAMVQDDIVGHSYVVESQGLHDAGHQVIGGLQDDLWASPQDPYFFFHHAQIDRIWSLWQGLNQTVRTKEVTDTLTIHNLIPSANGTLDTPVDMGFLADARTIGDLSSSIDGPFCYIYA